MIQRQKTGESFVSLGAAFGMSKSQAHRVFQYTRDAYNTEYISLAQLPDIAEETKLKSILYKKYADYPHVLYVMDGKTFKRLARRPEECGYKKWGRTSIFLIDRVFGMFRFVSLNHMGRKADIHCLRDTSLCNTPERMEWFINNIKVIADLGFKSLDLPNIVTPLKPVHEVVRLTLEEQNYCHKIRGIQRCVENIFAKVFSNSYRLGNTCKSNDPEGKEQAQNILTAVLLHNHEVLFQNKSIFDGPSWYWDARIQKINNELYINQIESQ